MYVTRVGCGKSYNARRVKVLETTKRTKLGSVRWRGDWPARWQTLFPVTHERISFKYGNQVAELRIKKAAPKDGFDKYLQFLLYILIYKVC